MLSLIHIYVKEVKDFSKSDKVLEVKNLSAKGFESVSFDLHAGEILGIAGQLGSGRTEPVSYTHLTAGWK